MKLFIIVNCVWLLLGWSCVNAEFTEIVETNKGPVRGKILKTVGSAKKYSSFRGIPFAKPPIKELRFKPPVENDAWSNVINATTESPLCIQVSSIDKLLRGSEDCLYLNVYTPKTEKFNEENEKLMAVMVWIYGGGFCEGVISSTFYGPDFLIDENVVVVAMNYRVGPLGFLSLNHTNATGNMGLKDQVLALKWVQKNIKRFGGDPKKVTIFGQSAGGASVSFHQISEASSGLFHAAIAMSGSALNPWALHSTENAISRAYELGRNLGLTTASKEELLEKLYNTPAEILTRQAEDLSEPKYMPFKPTLEHKNVAVNPFLSDSAYHKYKSENFTRVPTMLGFVEFETLSLAYENNDALNEIMKLMSDYLHVHLEKNYEVYNTTTAAFIYTAGIDHMQRYLSTGTEPVYYYKNSFDHKNSLHKFLGVKLNGTSHADDLLHIFYARDLYNSTAEGMSDAALNTHRRRMTKMWTNFAKYFDPTPLGTFDDLSNKIWLPSGQSGQYLDIGQNKLQMQTTRPIGEIAKKWQIVSETSNELLSGFHIV